MKKLFVLSVSIAFLSLQLKAQIGIIASWVNYDAPTWNSAIAANSNLSDNSLTFEQSGVQFAVDYWFRLKNKRIEFLPEISFFQLEQVFMNNSEPTFNANHTLSANIFQLHFNTQIYPFDFAGDCNCPTFSKDGDIFKKGLFIRVAPGVYYGSFEEEIEYLNNPSPTFETLQEEGIAASLRAGVGLDIGVSDFITITPIIQYTFSMAAGRYQLLSMPSENFAKSEITQLSFGVRLGFRFDELNKYGYR